MVIWRDMSLLDDVLSASGGLARWNSLSRFTLHLSISGKLFDGVGRAGEFKDVTAEGATRTQSIRFMGITGGKYSGSFQPDAITVETLHGEVLRTWRNPSPAFPDSDSAVLADELQLVFFCGVAIWNYVVGPFLLARPDVVVEELPPWEERKESWRRLRARIPPSVITLAPEQVFYFDADGLLRRTDHDLFGMKVVQYSWAHGSFGGLIAPTLRRVHMLQPDGSVVAKPVLMDIEIFDAFFE
ncbi:hypothetical protein GA0061099_100910 [Bradyrhizobium yuanmingense]|uniref:Uncharacterized protein n=2 Tax=Bradyrhizobium yuanmingense TaxID=108015 RepID=A0A1C3X336_9BRAD|nr:hypothetical protein IQ15_06863 [Bradyrhizobium yuanmingense]SCB46649.1 hypothetical protein GA0061099_100910 [Bradyrhizobium yuanmingense]